MTAQDKTVTRDIRGVTLTLLASNRSLELCSRMNYETENLDFIDQATPEDVLYDLGACEGRFSVYASLKGIPVYAFEPEADNFAAFQTNMRLNRLKEADIHAFNVGVGSENATAEMRIGQPWGGGHQKVIANQWDRQDLCFETKAKQSVSVVRLDDFIRENGLPLPTHIKIDIDGSEYGFLQGATETLATATLRNAIFELNVDDELYGQIMESMNGHGFKETSRVLIPNETSLYNVTFRKGR